MLPSKGIFIRQNEKVHVITKYFITASFSRGQRGKKREKQELFYIFVNQ
jgi:hypothetical protein